METLQHSPTVVASMRQRSFATILPHAAKPPRNRVLTVDLVRLTSDNVLDASELKTLRKERGKRGART
jgi:hypothetical protein